MKEFLSPLVWRFRELLFPLPDHKNDLPQTYETFIKTLKPQAKKTYEITSFFEYASPLVKSYIEEIKRYKNKTLFNFSGKMLGDFLSATYKKTSHKTFLIIPIPQTATRRRERGYDVTSFLVKKTLSHLPTFFIDGSNMLIHTKKIPQSGITHRKERINHSRGMFRINNNLLSHPSGQEVIILDDVCTTGASLTEAERVLTKAGYKVVGKITLAHA